MISTMYNGSGKQQLYIIYSSLIAISNHWNVQEIDSLGFWLSLLLSWLKFAESRLLLILRPVDASDLSVLHTFPFCCIFRYYYDVNMNTARGQNSVWRFPLLVFHSTLSVIPVSKSGLTKLRVWSGYKLFVTVSDKWAICVHVFLTKQTQDVSLFQFWLNAIFNFFF